MVDKNIVFLFIILASMPFIFAEEKIPTKLVVTGEPGLRIYIDVANVGYQTKVCSFNTTVKENGEAELFFNSEPDIALEIDLKAIQDGETIFSHKYGRYWAGQLINITLTDEVMEGYEENAPEENKTEENATITGQAVSEITGNATEEIKEEKQEDAEKEVVKKNIFTGMLVFRDESGDIF